MNVGAGSVCDEWAVGKTLQVYSSFTLTVLTRREKFPQFLGNDLSQHIISQINTELMFLFSFLIYTADSLNWTDQSLTLVSVCRWGWVCPLSGKNPVRQSKGDLAKEGELEERKWDRKSAGEGAGGWCHPSSWDLSPWVLFPSPGSYLLPFLISSPCPGSFPLCIFLP